MTNQNDFSKVNPVQDGVLVCTKKQGNIEQFKYIPLSQVKFKDGTSLGAYITAMEANQNKLEARLAECERLLGVSIEYQLAQAAEGESNEKDSIN